METKSSKFRWTVLGLVVIGLGLMSRLSPELILKLSPLRCPLNTLFGIRCPTCGLGHSLAFAVTGDWNRSFDAHFLGPIVLLVGLGWLTAWAFSIYRQPGK